MRAEEFRKQYLGLQYNQVNTLTPFAIDEMLEAYHESRVNAISDEYKKELEILIKSYDKNIKHKNFGLADKRRTQIEMVERNIKLLKK